MSRIFKEVVHPMYEEAEREQFNEKCRKIRGIAADAADFCQLDPYNDLGTLSATVEAVIAQCHEPLVVYTDSLKEAMRDYVNKFGEEEVKTDEERFDELCVKIKTTFAFDGYCLLGSYSPYRHIEQLSSIVELVVQNSQQPFVMQNACGGPPDMMSIMRGFVTKYSSEQYLPEIYVVE